MHRVGVFICHTCRGVVRMERTAVAMGRDSERGVILKRSEGAAFPGIGIEELLTQRLQCEAGGLPHERSICRNGDPPGFEPHFALSIGSCAALGSNDEN